MTDAVLAPSPLARVAAGAPTERQVPPDWPGHVCPNFSDWRAGDIVLVHAERTALGTAMRAGQRLSFQALLRQGAHVSHAALYVGGGKVIDASFGRPIEERDLWPYCQARAIELRRLGGLDLDPAIGEAIRDCARAYLGRPYALMEVLLSKLVPGMPPQRDALYCSTFVEVVIADATGVALAADPRCRPFYPAMLAAHPDLAVVPVEWRHFGPPCNAR